MGLFSTEKQEVNNMKELRRSLQEALDTQIDEVEEIKADIESKKDAILVAQSELNGVRLELQKKQLDVDRTEKALALVSGKRQRNSN
jgi:ABC-type phosphate transport system auxiliary subunit